MISIRGLIWGLIYNWWCLGTWWMLGDLTDSWAVTILKSRTSFAVSFTIITLYLHYVYMFMSIWCLVLSTFDDKVNGVFGGLASSTLDYFNFCGEIVQLQLGVWGVSSYHHSQWHNGVHIAGTWLTPGLLLLTSCTSFAVSFTFITCTYIMCTCSCIFDV